MSAISRKRCFLCCLSIIGVLLSAPAAAETVPLWAGEVPGALGQAETDIPVMTAYWPRPETATGAAVIVCPGGGYGHLAMDHEGAQIGRWLQEIGVAAFVLRYRLPGNGYRHPIPLLDAQRAIRLVRHRAGDWAIDPSRIGIMGFSAGGHLAASAGTHFETPATLTGIAADAVDAGSCRPDFMVLVYPVISMQAALTHAGSRKNLLGDNPDPKQVDLMSNEKQVTPRTPPTFLVHAGDDTVVMPENSLRFYEALRSAGVAAEMHLYVRCGHGFGMRPTAGPAAEWPRLCAQWLRQIQVLPAGDGD